MSWAHSSEHPAVVPVLHYYPGCLVYFSFDIDSVTSLIMCWLMALSPPTCFSSPDCWNLCVSALLEDITVHNRCQLWWMMFCFFNNTLKYHFFAFLLTDNEISFFFKLPQTFLDMHLKLKLNGRAWCSCRCVRAVNSLSEFSSLWNYIWWQTKAD